MTLTTSIIDYWVSYKLPFVRVQKKPWLTFVLKMILTLVLSYYKPPRSLVLSPYLV